MKCPFCDFADSVVKDSRTNNEKNITRRRRFCPKCELKFTTFEKVQLKELFVIKRSGKKRPFDPSKIEKSIKTVLHKRNVSSDQVNKIVENIVLDIEANNNKEISTRKIGDFILSELAKIDQVAYVRFASVYKDFSSAKDFAVFVSKIKR